MRHGLVLAVLSAVLTVFGPVHGTVPAAIRPSGSPGGPGSPVDVGRPGGWSAPVGPPDAAPRVGRAFEAPAGPYAAGHRGVDLPAGAGSPVRAPVAGVVVFAGMVAGRPVITLSHAGGLRSTYEPVRAVVRRGNAVASRQIIGTLVAAPSHCLPDACLHWGVYSPPRDYRDPMALLGRRGPPILLPVPRSARAGSG